MERLKELLQIMEKKQKNASPARAGAKTLNDALKTRRGGRHYSSFTDYDRAKEKEKVRRELSEEQGSPAD